MSVNLIRILQDNTPLPIELCPFVELYADSPEEALMRVGADFSQLSPQMQAQIKENGKELLQLKLPTVTLTKEIAMQLLDVFPKLEQLFVKQGCVNIERKPKLEIDGEYPFVLEYVVDSAFVRWNNNTTNYATKDALLEHLVDELNDEEMTAHCQYELAITLPNDAITVH